MQERLWSFFILQCSIMQYIQWKIEYRALKLCNFLPRQPNLANFGVTQCSLAGRSGARKRRWYTYLQMMCWIVTPRLPPLFPGRTPVLFGVIGKDWTSADKDGGGLAKTLGGGEDHLWSQFLVWTLEYFPNRILQFVFFGSQLPCF